MANRRFIDFPVATTVGANDIILIWQDGLNKQTTKGTILSGLPEDLEDLEDVNISGLTNGQILRYDSTTGKWVNADQANLDLADLNDVSIVSPSNGQVLVYNSTTGKWENSSAGFVPYVGAVTTVDLGAQGLRAGYVRFNTSVVSVPDEQGIMFWDADDETVDVILNGYTMKIGEDLFYPVKNQTGSTIAKGTAVRFNGTVGASGRLLIAPFIADGSVASSRFMGVTAEEILNGEDGKVLYFGRIRGINTDAFNEGDILYASTTVAGGYQTAIPVAPNNIVQVAAVVTKSINQGTIFVRPTLGSNLNTNESVKFTSVADKNLLQYQSGTGLWENKTLGQVIGGTSSQFLKGDGSLDSTTYQSTADKGQPNGYASLDSNGKVPLAQINDALIGNVNFQGLWNAATNSPTLVNPPSAGTKGYYYIVSTAGTFAGISFEVGDWIISNGSAWGKVDNTDAVSSVFGRTGNVTAANGDYTTAQVTESGNLYYTDARSRAALSFAAGSGAYNSSTGVITIPTNNNQITNGAGYITSAALSGYLPLTGGTLTGALNGTSATFTSIIKSSASSGAGQIIAEGTATNGEGTFTVIGKNSSGTERSAIFKYDNEDVIRLGTSSPINLRFETNDAERMRITLDGAMFMRRVNSDLTFEDSVGGLYVRLNGNVAGNAEELRVFGRNIGFYSHTGSRYASITSLGNVLIGTETPNGNLLRVNGTGFFDSSVTASSFIKSGGTSSQYLMADGSVSTLSNPVTGTGTTNYLPKFTGSTTIGNSQIFDDGTNIQIGNIPLGGKLNITNGNAHLNIYFASGTSAGWDSSLFIRGGSTTSNSSLNLGYSGSDNDAYIRRNSDGRLSLGTSQNDKISIFFGGNVFIGSSVGMSDNGAKLQVSGNLTINASDDILRFGNLLRWGFQRPTTDNRYVSFVRQANATAIPVWTVDGDNGNVGIGTTSPDKRLHLYASNDAASVRLTNTAAAKVWDLTPALPGIANSGFSIYNVTDNSTPFHITDGGNVLIGTTTDSGQKLQVNGAIKSSVSSGGSVVTSESTATNGEGQFVISGKNSSGTTRSASFKYDNADIIRLGTSSNISMRFETNDAERMRLTSDGAMYMTRVNSDLTFADSVGGLYVRTNGNIAGNAEELRVFGRNIAFFSHSGSRFASINSSGNVLIGTTTDVGAKLYVNGAIRTEPIGSGAITGNWKFGNQVSGTISENTSLLVEIDGIEYRINARQV